MECGAEKTVHNSSSYLVVEVAMSNMYLSRSITLHLTRQQYQRSTSLWINSSVPNVLLTQVRCPQHASGRTRARTRVDDRRRQSKH